MSGERSPHPRTPGQIFAVPALLALTSTVGLVVALTGDGWRDLVSWIALAIPVLAVAHAMRFRRT